MKFPFHERRLINHFKVGADPEFVLIKQRGTYVHASTLVEAGGNGPFGADGSGRQAELRAFPSRSALEVVASLAEALQGFYTHVPKVRELTWLATPFYENDGCGGHIHFGRKQLPRRRKEVVALDQMARYLLHTNLLDPESQRERVVNSGYGHFSDARCQKYGYEYRTLPTWLNTPALAFLCITASKLAVVDSIADTDPWSPVTLPALCEKYAGRDNDAALAQRILKRTSPNDFSTRDDLKRSWAIRTNLYGPETFVAPDPATTAALGESFWHWTPFPGSQRPKPHTGRVWRLIFKQGVLPKVSTEFWVQTNELWHQAFAQDCRRLQIYLGGTKAFELYDGATDFDLMVPPSALLRDEILPPTKESTASKIKQWNRLFVEPIKMEVTGTDYVRDQGIDYVRNCGN